MTWISDREARQLMRALAQRPQTKVLNVKLEERPINKHRWVNPKAKGGGRWNNAAKQTKPVQQLHLGAAPVLFPGQGPHN